MEPGGRELREQRRRARAASAELEPPPQLDGHAGAVKGPAHGAVELGVERLGGVGVGAGGHQGGDVAAAGQVRGWGVVLRWRGLGLTNAQAVKAKASANSIEWLRSARRRSASAAQPQPRLTRDAGPHRRRDRQDQPRQRERDRRAARPAAGRGHCWELGCHSPAVWGWRRLCTSPLTLRHKSCSWAGRPAGRRLGPDGSRRRRSLPPLRVANVRSPWGAPAAKSF